jgi:hypothetical protein
MFYSLYGLFRRSGGLFRLLLLSALLPAVLSCSKSSSTPSYDTTDPTVSAFGFASNDSFPGLSAAKFLVEALADTGCIRLMEKDSMLFGTSLRQVVPVVRYNSVPSAAIWYLGDTSQLLTGYDTLDFTRSPIYLRVYAADREHEKWYRILPRVHQVDPDRYVWRRTTAQIAPPRSAEQHAMLADGRFCFFTNDGFTTSLFTSSDAAQWEQQTVTGLPADCHVRTVVYDSLSSLFCYVADTVVYTSPDGAVWDTGFKDLWDKQWTCLSLLMSFDNKVWAVVRSGDVFRLATLDLKNSLFVLQWEVDAAGFPVSDFSVVPFPGSSDRRQALLAGGYTADGRMTGGCYAFEAAPTGCRMVRLHEGMTGLQPFAGAGMAWYGKRMVWYGGMDNGLALMDGMRVSLTEGMTWTALTDTTHSPWPADFGARWRVSAFAQGDYIWLVGGQTASGFMTDVWRGRLNSVDW